MSDKRNLALVIAFAFLCGSGLGLTITGRYQFQGFKDTTYVLRFDRWTGNYILAKADEVRSNKYECRHLTGNTATCSAGRQKCGMDL